jgi:hypothetical protein
MLRGPGRKANLSFHPHQQVGADQENHPDNEYYGTFDIHSTASQGTFSEFWFS